MSEAKIHRRFWISASVVETQKGKFNARRIIPKLVDLYVPQCGFSAATQFRENDGSGKNGRHFRCDTERTCLVSDLCPWRKKKKKQELQAQSILVTNMSLSLVKEEPAIVNFHPGFASERAEFYLPSRSVIRRMAKRTLAIKICPPGAPSMTLSENEKVPLTRTRNGERSPSRESRNDEERHIPLIAATRTANSKLALMIRRNDPHPSSNLACACIRVYRVNVQFIRRESFSVREFELSCRVEKLNGYTRPTRFRREPRIFYHAAKTTSASSNLPHNLHGVSYIALSLSLPPSLSLSLSIFRTMLRHMYAEVSVQQQSALNARPRIDRPLLLKILGNRARYNR